MPFAYVGYALQHNPISAPDVEDRLVARQVLVRDGNWHVTSRKHVSVATLGIINITLTNITLTSGNRASLSCIGDDNIDTCTF